jgi:hypothetical protein
MKLPLTSTFWRFLLATVSFFTVYAYWDLIETTRRLGVLVSSSKSWIGLFFVFSIFALFMLSLFVVSYSSRGKHFLETLEVTVTRTQFQTYVGALFLIAGLSGFAIFTSNPYFINVFGPANGIRYLILLLFSVLGMWGIRMLRNRTSWITAFIVILLGQSLIQLVLFFFAQVTAYPFAMGWSETSRFYFPSLFLSEKVYGQKFPWPVLHPTLHLLLAPPYLVDAPLWFHRFWQVVIRFMLIGLIIPPLLKRLAIENRLLHWLVSLWMFLFLFTGPIYFHLAVPVIIIVWGFSSQNATRTWVAVILASLWAGWSRVNWYPVPAMLAAVLYFFVVPIQKKRLWQYLLQPFLWFVVGTTIAFLFQRAYVALSGIHDSGSFYTSLSSDLLWYRLLPNASYFLGLIPAGLLLSLPMWLVIYLVIRANRTEAWHPFRLCIIFAALFVLLLGGLLVSLKIGGGVDLHNLDAYLVLLLIVFSYLVFARYRMENGELSRPILLPWLLVLALILMPAWSYLRFNIRFPIYDPMRTQTVLPSLQRYVDEVNARNGEILFITQRHLISMHMLKEVTLVPEYEREDLMEMAMAGNTEYLTRFRADIERQRFALIVVDPLNFNLMSRKRSFADENNVWVRRIMKHILCNYRQETTFVEDDIALYVPQEGVRQCPQNGSNEFDAPRGEGNHAEQ